MQKEMISEKTPGRQYKIILGFLFVFMLLLTLIGDYKTVFYGADIDESYALTMAMRLVKGDRLLLEMWEPHQLSALLYAPLVWVYTLFSGQFSEGIVIFLRIIGCVIQAVIGLALYRTLARKGSRLAAMTAAFMYVNFTPKQIQAPEFTIIFYWTMTVLLILLWRIFEPADGKRSEDTGSLVSLKSDDNENMKPAFINTKAAAYVGIGLCLSVMVLCYPSAVLIFMYVILLMWLSKDRRSVLIIIAVCFTCACFLFLYMLIGGDLTGRLSNISNVLMDEAHSQPMAAKLVGNLRDIVSMLTVTGGIMVITLSGRKVLEKKKDLYKILLAVLFITQGIWMIVQFHSYNGVNYQELLPIVLQLSLIGIWFMDKRALSIWGMITVLSTLCVMMMSNVITRASMGFLLPAVLYGIVHLAERLKDKKPALWALVFMTVVLALQVFGVRTLLVRYSGNQRRNIFEDYYTENKGAIAGIKLSADDWQHVEMLDGLYIKYAMDGSSVLYMGADMYLYSLLDNSQIGTGNTLSTPGFGEQILKWYDKNPERIPDYIFAEHGYIEDFGNYLGIEPFASFVRENYDIDKGWDEGTVTVYRKR